MGIAPSGTPHATSTTLQRSHIRHFSQSHTLRLRRTYFPKRGNGEPHKSEDFFSQLKATINALPSSVVLWTVLGLNGVVYILWNVGIFRAVCVFKHSSTLD